MISRDQIASVLEGVPGLASDRATPQTIVAGSAWPVWVSTRWLNNCARETRWYVFVALTGADGHASVDEGDPLVEQVGQALTALGLGGITVEPWQWAVEPGGQAVPALRFTAVD